MAAVRIAQAPQRVIIFGKEKRRIGAIRGIVVKELVHRSEERFRLIQSDRTLPDIRLEIGHQKSGSDMSPMTRPTRCRPRFRKS